MISGKLTLCLEITPTEPKRPKPRRGFTIRLKRLKPRAPDFRRLQNFGSKENIQQENIQHYKP